jgi:hypothetical protein
VSVSASTSSSKREGSLEEYVLHHVGGIDPAAQAKIDAHREHAIESLLRWPWSSEPSAGTVALRSSRATGDRVWFQTRAGFALRILHGKKSGTGHADELGRLRVPSSVPAPVDRPVGSSTESVTRDRRCRHRREFRWFDPTASDYQLFDGLVEEHRNVPVPKVRQAKSASPSPSRSPSAMDHAWPPPHKRQGLRT